MTQDERPATGEIQASLELSTQRWAAGKPSAAQPGFGVGPGPEGSGREPKDPSRTTELASGRVV